MNFNQVYFIILPQFLVLGFIFIVPSIIRNIVSEKETGIKVYKYRKSLLLYYILQFNELGTDENDGTTELDALVGMDAKLTYRSNAKRYNRYCPFLHSI